MLAASSVASSSARWRGLARPTGTPSPRTQRRRDACHTGPTWGNCARGLSVAHEAKESVGKGRRARCAAVERSCEQRRAIFERNNYELMAIERWADNGGAVCSPDIWHATLLRDPLDRIVSHHNHLWSTILRAKPRGHEKIRSLPDQYFRGVFADDRSCIPAKELPYTMSAPHRTGYDWSMVCALSSDYHTRSLLGTSYSVWKSKFSSASVLNHRVVLHAIDATPARWRGDAGSSPLDRARTAAPSPRGDLVKNCRVHPTHWLISTQVFTNNSRYWAL